MKKHIFVLALLFILAVAFGCVKAPAEVPVVIVEVTPSPTPEPTPTPTPTPEPTPIVVFAVGGDSRGSGRSDEDDPEADYVNKIALTEGLTAIAATEAEFMVYTGDFTLGDEVNSGQAMQYDIWMRTATAIVPETFFYPVLGNHERQSEEINGMLLFGDVFDEFTPTEFFDPDTYDRTNYLVRKGACNLFILNGDFYSNRGYIGDDVLAWVAEKAAEGGDYNFFFVHKPCYPIGRHIGSSMDLNPEQRDKLWTLVQSLPGAIYFNAHEHMYYRRAVDSSFNEDYVNTVYQITSAGMGAPYHDIFEDMRGIVSGPVHAWHYVLVTVWPDRAEFSAIDVDGNVLDEFTVAAG